MPTIDQLVAAKRAEIRVILQLVKDEGRDRLTQVEDRECDLLEVELRKLLAVHADENRLTATDRAPGIPDLGIRAGRAGGGRVGAGADYRSSVGDGPRWVRTHDRKPATVARGQRFARPRGRHPGRRC